MSDDVVIHCNGDNYSGWTSTRVTRTLRRLCNEFSVTYADEGLPVGKKGLPLGRGDAVKVSVGGELVVSGYVDDALPRYDAQQHAIGVEGRSKAADLVDCGLPAQQWTQPMTLLELAEAICKRFGITVRAETDVGKPFPQAAVTNGETGLEFLKKLAAQRGVRLFSAADGAVIIGRTGTARAPDALRLGVNIRAARGRFSQRDRYNTITVVAQTPGTDNWNGTNAAVCSGSATDAGIRSDRQHVIVASNVADAAACQARAEWQRNTDYGKGEALTYTVSGWRHRDGLWTPNTRVHVVDPWMRLDAEMLIPEVHYIEDDQGKRTEIQVMPPEAFDLIALPPSMATGSVLWN